MTIRKKAPKSRAAARRAKRAERVALSPKELREQVAEAKRRAATSRAKKRLPPPIPVAPDEEPLSRLEARLRAAFAKIEDTECYYFDVDEAVRKCLFFPRHLVHVKGDLAGRPLHLQDWAYLQLIGPLFGWKRRSDGTRRYRTVFVMLPRKNAKSTIGAGIALILLTADGEKGAEVYSAASDREQAGIVFGMAKAMAEKSREVRRRVRPYRNSLVAKKSGNFYKAISAEVAGKHGFNGHGIVFDELHAQPNRDLWDVLTTSTGSRSQPVTLVITTAGFDRHSICYEQYLYAVKVRDGIVPDDTFLPVIFGADADDDWEDPATWQKANPGYGVTVREDYLRGEYLKAKENPAYENTFRRLHLDQWTEQDVRWLSVAPGSKWQRCPARPSPEELLGRACWAGLDLSSLYDLTAFVLAFKEVTVERTFVDLLPFFWLPEENLAKRVKKDRVPYDVWVRQGLIALTPGDLIDYDFIRRDINRLGERYQIRKIAIDRWNATQIATQLAESDGFEVELFGQGFASMAAPTKELSKLVGAGELRHGHNPVLTWMMSNMVVATDAAGNEKPAKDKARERIDGVVAAIMSLALASGEPGDGSSIYEKRGVLTVGGAER